MDKSNTAYYWVGNGFGNIVQTTPAYNYLCKSYSKVVACYKKEYSDFVKTVYKDHPKVSANQIVGGDIYRCCSPTEFNLGGNISEVEANLKLVGCSEPAPEDKLGFCSYEEVDEGFDILICDGYNKRKNKTDWLVKSYPNWEDVVSSLHGKYTIASIGLEDEYIPSTYNRTGLGLDKTLGLIKNSKLLVCNDTGFYHAANVLGTKCVVLFTMTDVTKNYDQDFHRLTKIVKTNLPCQPCQLKEKIYWIKNKENCGWACRDIPINVVLKEILSFMEN